MAQREAIERAITAIDPGAAVIDVTELLGGASADVRRVDYRDVRGAVRHVVFRQHRSAFKGHDEHVATAEHRVVEALWQRGFAVPRPLLLDDSGALTGPFTLTEWVDGSPQVASSDLVPALEQMADFLARLHDLDPAELDVQIEELEDPVAGLGAYLPDDDLGTRLRELVTSGSLTHTPNRAVLTHGDYWPGNVLWRDGRLVAVIDWEDARIGDPLADLACARVELRCEYGTEATETFTECYVRNAADRGHGLRLDGLPLWDVYVSAAALTTMALWGLDPSEEARRRATTTAFYAEAATRVLDS